MERLVAAGLASMVVALSLVAAGYGGAPQRPVAQLLTAASQSTVSLDHSTASAQVTGLLAFSHCMRSQGIGSFPDPGSSGVLPKQTAQQLGVSDSRLLAAESRCQRLLPDGGVPTEPALQGAWSAMRRFTQCMRSHGIRNFPDPVASPQHPERPTFDLQPVGIDPTSPPVSTEVHACGPLLRTISNPQNLGLGGP